MAADQCPAGLASDHLPAGECLDLMASVPVGRVVYTRGALPAVELVSFTLDNSDIVIRPYDLSGVAMAASQVVAFEAGELDCRSGSGWSVTVAGQARHVTAAAELAQLTAISTRPLTAHQRTCFLRITPGPITGRRLYRAS
jgi:hypothetical protein